MYLFLFVVLIKMVYTFTFVKSSAGKTKDVFSKLKQIEGIERAHAVFGEWDVLCIVNSDNLNVAAQTVLDKIHNIDGVTNTSTIVEAQI